MGNFFKNAPPPVRDSEQKRVMDAIHRRENVLASFPLGYVSPALYSFSAFLGNQVLVVICGSAAQIQRNLYFFRGVGVSAPEIAYLDATLMPHEERVVRAHLNENKVRLLYTTPEKFTSLTFLEILVHLDLSAIVIEEADRFLPATLGHAAYRHLFSEGLDRLRRLPPLILLTPPLAPGRQRELATHVQLKSFDVLRIDPRFDSVQVSVKRCVTEHQKVQALVNWLSGDPGQGHIAKPDTPGFVLIQTAYPAAAEKLAASLIDFGFQNVTVTHFKKPPADQRSVFDAAGRDTDSIIVNAGAESRYWNAPPGAAMRVVFWASPAGVDELVGTIFRNGATRENGGDIEMTLATRALILYTKEDYLDAVTRLRQSTVLSFAESHERVLRLKHFRRWVLSPTCRLQTLIAYYQGSANVTFAPCGRCDRCREASSRPGGILGTVYTLFAAIWNRCAF